VARHDRVLASHVTVTDPAHDQARESARALVSAPKPTIDADVEVRDLAVYDRARGRRDGRRELAYLCQQLKAPSLLAGVQRLGERARAEAWSHEEFLAACLEREVSARQSHGGEARIRAARFPARKTLEDFDFEHQRSVRADVVAHLGALDFIEARSNAVFLGPPGTGKSHLSIALGVRACLAGHRVAFATATSGSTASAARTTPAASKTSSADSAGSPSSSSTRSATSPSGRSRQPVLQLVSSRYERASVIVSSNKAFSRWGEVFGDDTVASAMIDRLVHHAEVINLKGDSYRLKGRDLGRTPPNDR